jgi:hypothetical protein
VAADQQLGERVLRRPSGEETAGLRGAGRLGRIDAGPPGRAGMVEKRADVPFGFECAGQEGVVAVLVRDRDAASLIRIGDVAGASASSPMIVSQSRPSAASISVLSTFVVMARLPLRCAHRSA